MAFKAGAIYGEARLDTKKWTSGLKSLGKATAVAGAAIAAAFVATMTKAVKAANEFQIAMSNVRSIADEGSISVQKLALQLLTLNPALGDATELAKGMYQAISAGAVTAEDAMQTTIDAAVFSKAVLTDTFTAVDVLTTAVNAYGRETIDTTKAADIFFQTVKLGKVTGDELASSIGLAIPLYASTGIALEELTSGLAAMTKQGVNARIATTQLRAIVVAFLSPSEAMTEALKDMGYESGSAFLKAEGLAGALKLIEEASEGDAAKMRELLPNVRALQGAMALTGVGGETFNETLRAMADATGSAAEAFEKQEKTFQTFRNASKNLLTVVGNIGKHFIDKIAVGATTATNSIIQFLTSTQGMELVAKIIGYVAAGWEAIKIAVKPIIDTLGPALKEIWGAVGELLGTLTGKTTESGGAMKILSVVVNLVTAAINVFSGTIVDGIQILKDWITAIKESAGTVGKFFQFLGGKAKWQEVKDQAKLAGEAFKGLGSSYKEFFVGTFETIRDEVLKFSGATEELTAELEINVKAAFDNASTFIQANWAELLTGQGDFIEALNSNFASVPQVTAEGEDEMTEKTKGVVKTLKEMWVGLWDEARDSGEVSFEVLNDILDRALRQNIIDLEKYNDMSLELWTDHWNEMIDVASEKFNIIRGTIQYGFDTLFGIGEQFRTNEKAEQDLYYQNRLSSLESQLAVGILTEEEFNQKKADLDEEALDKENALREKAFYADKLNRITSVAINAADSIMGWWAQAPKLGPIAGPAFAGTMTAATLLASTIQTALIAQQKFVPSREQGGMTGGATRINERGGEIITLPDNSQVIPADISRQIGKSIGSGTVINVSFDGAQISNDMDLEYVTDVVVKKIGRRMRLVG